MSTSKKTHKQNPEPEGNRGSASRTVDVEAYFRRIGYEGPKKPSLACLKALHFLHPQAIPFENLSPFLGIPVFLDKHSLQQKLIHQRRGGYCFEHNLLLSYVLQTLGFKVTQLAARILWNMPEGTITARGHMLLLVEAEDNRHIVDVGFGGLTLTAPLLLQTDTIRETPHEPFRLLKQTEYYILQAKINKTWHPLYKFTLEEQFLADYEVSNWYLSNHPESHFVTGLIAARSKPDRRYALRNNQLSVHYLNGTTEKQVITNPDKLRNILEEIFTIKLPPALDPGRDFHRILHTENKEETS